MKDAIATAKTYSGLPSAARSGSCLRTDQGGPALAYRKGSHCLANIGRSTFPERQDYGEAPADHKRRAKRLARIVSELATTHQEPMHLRSRAKRGMLPLGAAGCQTSARMKAKRRLPDDVLAVLREGKGLRIRAGTSQHRFIGIWVVVVNDRAFIRSWSVKPSEGPLRHYPDSRSRNRGSRRSHQGRASKGCRRSSVLAKVQHSGCPQVCQGFRKPEIQRYDR